MFGCCVKEQRTSWHILGFFHTKARAESALDLEHWNDGGAFAFLGIGDDIALEYDIVLFPGGQLGGA